MASTPRKSYIDISSTRRRVTTWAQGSGPTDVAKDGAGKQPGVAENGIVSATPEEIRTVAPPRAHFYYVRANDEDPTRYSDYCNH